MLPTQRARLFQALADLHPAAGADHEVRVRVGLHDGTVVDGALLSASLEHLSVRLPDAEARLVAAQDIHSLHLAMRRPARELLVVSGLIIVITAVLVGIASIAPLRPHLPSIAGGLAILGFAGVTVLQRHTRLGHWLTSWQTVFDADKA